jgi:hypothetical protein
MRFFAASSLWLSSLLLWLQTASFAKADLAVERLHLVDADSGNDIMELTDGMVIDAEEFGPSLTIRAETNGEPGYVSFDLDGGTVQRVEREPPYFFAGKDGEGKPYTAHSISNVGRHTLTVGPNPDGMLMANQVQYTGGGSSGAQQRKRQLKATNDGFITIFFETIQGSSLPEEERFKGFETDVGGYNVATQGALTGELKKWHKITLGFGGPPASELGMTVPGAYRPPSVFADYRLNCIFTHSEGKSYTVPGYFAADGNAANTGAQSGNIWFCHFTPNQTGVWYWTAKFLEGTNIAVNGGGDPSGFFDESVGSFEVGPSDKAGRDLRAKGRLERVAGKHHLRFAETDEYFLKFGPDSPENLLAYEEFDGTPNHGGYRKSWEPHKLDYSFGPTWNEGNGTGLIGAINYLASKGVNVLSVTTLNGGGSDKNVFPFVTDEVDDQLHYDVSKLAQWQVVFEYAEQMGMALHVKLQDAGSDDLLDEGSLLEERKLYYREMIARFGHLLGIIWNLGEETTDFQAIKERSEYIREVDPYNSPIIVHTLPEMQTLHQQLLGLTTIDGVSLHSAINSAHADALELVESSATSGHPWIVSCDEQGDSNTGVKPDAEDPNNRDIVRQDVLWGNLLAGGSGVQYYFGLSYDESDLTLQNFRSRDALWDQSRHAVDFFTGNNVPFWDMHNSNDLVSEGSMCLADPNAETYVVYKKLGITGTVSINLPASGAPTYTVHWYNPREGGILVTGTVESVQAGSQSDIGVPLTDPDFDWVALLKAVHD